MRYLLCLIILYALITGIQGTAVAQETSKIYNSQEISGAHLPFSQWQNLPILHDGRIKPLHSLASTQLQRLSGKDRLRNLSAPQWLATTFFTPEAAISLPIFKISEPEQYNLTPQTQNLYSYRDLSQVIQANKTEIEALNQNETSRWSSEQKKLFDLYENHLLYTEMLRAFTGVIAFNDISDVVDQKSILENLKKQTTKIVENKGDNLKNYTEEEQNIVAKSFLLESLQTGGAYNKVARLIPQTSPTGTTIWHTPWELILSHNVNSPSNIQSDLKSWKEMATAFQTGDQIQWNTAINDIQKSLKTKIGNKNNLFFKLKIETFYNITHFYQLSFYCYVFALFLIISGSLFCTQKDMLKTIHRFSGMAFLMGVALHSAEIILRIYLLARPPVGTLYESIIFVSLICIYTGAYISFIQKNNIGYFISALIGVILYFISKSFSGPDTMGTLVAVLNTNFWLGAHVLCITIGYGLCLVTSLLAHTNLIFKRYTPPPPLKQCANENNIKTLLLISLLFTAIGTILGGIWADQSWGRFWGWDPKENGALLIVLWIIWLLHSRLSGHLKSTGFIIGCAFLSVIVVFAWFGVNLLNVGLHSYGFVNGIFWGIVLFTIFETLTIFSLWALQKNHKNNNRQRNKTTC